MRLLCLPLLVTVGCVVTPPHHPSIEEQTPDHPPATEMVAPPTVVPDPPVAQPVQSAKERQHQPMTRPVATTMPRRPGEWNPAKGEHSPDRVAPPPARHCRTVAATETQGRVYTARQADGSYSVGVEPVPGEVVPLEICP